jgi:hypothetical protein
MTDLTLCAQCGKTVPTSTGRASRRATSTTAAAGTPGEGALLRPGPSESAVPDFQANGSSKPWRCH